MPSLTLSMIVKNEEQYLAECLQSVQGIADEIVLVDTGSSDSTKEIAGKFNAKVYDFPWTNDFSEARNFALKNSTGKWILYLDADERLSASSRGELKKIIQSENNEAVYCTVNSIDEYTHRPNLMRYTRLFRNGENIKFEGKVHEQIENSLKNNGYSFLDSAVEIIHLGYNVSEEAKIEKARRNLKLLEAEYRENETSYYAFQIAQTYNLIGEKDKAIDFFNIALKDENLQVHYKAISYLFLANQYFQKHNLSDAYDSIKNGLKYGRRQPSLNLLAGKIAFKLNRIDEALDFVKNALTFNRINNSDLPLVILLDEEEIIYNGLYMSLHLSECDFFNSFKKELFNYWAKSNRFNYNDNYNLFNKILGKRGLSTAEMNLLKGLMDETTKETYLALIARYNSDVRKKILTELYKDFSGEIRFVNLYADVLTETFDINKAIEVLEAGLNLPEKDPSTYFYLISLYIRKNNFDKVSELVENAIKEFSHIDEVKKKLDILMEKLSSAIK